jgi:fluoride ion exporter CrcB/FEX
MILNGIHLTNIDISPYLHHLLFLFIGVLGGFTTYSTFGFESMVLLKDGGHAQSLTQYHPAYHGLAAVRLGDTLGRLKLLN